MRKEEKSIRKTKRKEMKIRAEKHLLERRKTEAAQNSFNCFNALSMVMHSQ